MTHNSEESIELLERLGAHDFDPICQYRGDEAPCEQKTAVDVGWTLICCSTQRSAMLCRSHHDAFIARLMERGSGSICPVCGHVVPSSHSILDRIHLDWSRPL